MENYYKNAVKRGQKYNRQRLAKGAYPNLPVLDEILPENKQMTGRDLGLVQIPSEWIVGTVSSARAVSFAGNFMPAADEKSEFAMKWK
ncbi:MAG: simple sugar transporter substrate-binding protein, partial [Eubacterium sp.]|nr:simple sugar transporter substrate-binding protein [Eubacterium sp.]